MLNLVVSLDINNFNGRKSVSVKIKDMRPCSFEQYRFFSAKWAFEDIMRGEVEDPKIKARALPNRNEIAAIYRTLHNLKKFEGNAEKLYLLTLKSGMNYCRNFKGTRITRNGRRWKNYGDEGGYCQSKPFGI